uniref:Uncharacterized protein n=1 Tax=Kalanchoe fedtschenkoi TaxID=63787 RepID=A0A7N0T7U4_KALFE
MDYNNTSAEMGQCGREAVRREVNYICFRIRKDLDIEPEATPASVNSKAVNNKCEDEREWQRLCGRAHEAGEATKTAEDAEDFLSAHEVENSETDEASSSSSSTTSFAFPVLDARWSGSPVQMPTRTSSHKHPRFLRKSPILFCRWC